VATILARRFSTIGKLQAAGVDELAEVHEIGDAIAASVHEWLASPYGRRVIAGLSAADVRLDLPEAEQAVEGPLTGKTVVLNLIPASQSQGQAFCDALTSIAQPYDIRSGNHRYGGKYCQTHDFVTSTGTFPRGVPHEEVAIIVRMIRETMSRLQAPPV
jgi:hypothetical protein